MKFKCRVISIKDEELGCQVTFSEKKDFGEETANMSVQALIDTIGRYLLLQRSYPEDDFESGNYYFETHDENLCGDLVDYEMMLTRTRFVLKILNETIEVLINPTDKEFTQLTKVLPILADKKGKLVIND